MKKMKFIKTTFTVLLFGTLLTGCGNSSSDDDDGGGSQPPSSYLEVQILPTGGHQHIHSFGASDAWSTQFVGKNWPLEKRNMIADLLFSKDVKPDGSPKGIGLNSWRFNIGAGSATQGAPSGIDDEWRRAESFMTDHGYDWTAHEGQRWFLQAAKLRGVDHFTAFSNSPPIYMTKNGKAHSSGGTSANLDQDEYDDFAEFLAEVIENLYNNDGIQFDYISPFNEPQWDWAGGQEGSPWLNDEVAEVTKVLNQKLNQSSLGTKIEIAEAGKLNYLYENADKPGRADQLNTFFDPNSSAYLGNLEHLAQKIAGHSYYTTYGTSTLLSTRKSLFGKINSLDPSLEFWMTEYCLLENNNEINGNGRDLGIDPALYLGRVIYADLAVANASHWSWWLAVSPYDYKDGLVYIDSNKNNGMVYDSKMLWAMGHYSRFIKEGYQRVELKRSDNQSLEQSINGLLISAYKSPDSSKVVVVMVNQRTIEIPVKVKIEGKATYDGKVFQTTASKDENLTYKGTFSGEDVWKVPARSLVTIEIQ